MKQKYKKLQVTVRTNFYDIGNHLSDLIDFFCPYSKREVSMDRRTVADLSVYDKIAAEEWKYYAPGQRMNYTLNGEMEFVIKVTDDEYAEIFYGCEDGKAISSDEEDLTKLYTYINLKIFEILRTPEQFLKYTSIQDDKGNRKDDATTQNKPEDNAIIFENIEEHEIDWFVKTADENGCECRIGWQSVYNPSVVYDSKPFAYEGFRIIARITCKDYNKALFVKHLYKTKMHNALFLYNCYKGETHDISCNKERSAKI